MAIGASLVMGIFALVNPWSHCVERMERVGLGEEVWPGFRGTSDD
jgi:hypothetical protein